MPGRTNNQRFLLWLALGTAAMALAMASLLVFELAQKRAIDQSNAIRSDSLTALAFQFEREFLRTRQSLGETLASGEPAELEALSLRYDIFLSRLTLLQDSPSVNLLMPRAEYRKVIPAVDLLVVEMDQAMASTPVNRAALQHILGQLNGLGPDVQALTLAANSEVAHLLEQQVDTMRRQNGLIVGLTVAQLVLLLVASGLLLLRQKRMESERLALEKMTEALRHAHFRAEAANRGKSQFLANMSHELRTPFNGLMGMLGLLENTALTPQQSDYIQTAQGSASHLLTLLNDILDLSALETGKLTLKPTTVELQSLLRDVQALMQTQARSKGLEFQLHMPPTPLPRVLADETRVKQILFNLISNAIKFTDSGCVTLTVSVGKRSDETLSLVFEISDTGIGMDANVLAQLFQRFYQVEDGSTRRFGGTGLGLEISQSLAAMMQGEITVVSAVGVGSAFTLRLALPIEADPGIPLATVENVTPSPPLFVAPARSVESQSLHVLVVEDHPVNQKLVGVLLGRMGCRLEFCENGQLALDRVQQQGFDMILMDVNMPVMDGLTATRLIRALPGAVAQTPIVVFTADVMNEAREQALAAGANDFITKPVNVEQLRTIVQKYAAAKALV